MNWQARAASEDRQSSAAGSQCSDLCISTETWGADLSESKCWLLATVHRSAQQNDVHGGIKGQAVVQLNNMSRDGCWIWFVTEDGAGYFQRGAEDAWMRVLVSAYR
jgi:hypothetical protein